MARSPRAAYGLVARPEPVPELAPEARQTVALHTLRALFHEWGLDPGAYGTPDWNPLAAFIRPGSTVLLKPNLVLHYNQSGEGMDCLLTHYSLIEAVIEYVALAGAGRISVGDAPLQACNFRMLQEWGLDDVMARFRARGIEVHLVDFRRTVMQGTELGMPKEEDRRPLEDYVLFDLGRESLLEPLAADADKFRVTVYNPDLLNRTHQPGKHEYLIAREVIEADTVINLPKLKSHKKACITGALKNLIGINGNKEYLPHHRKGGSGSGGDCYEGSWWVKDRIEDILDHANRLEPGSQQRMLNTAVNKLTSVAVMLGSDDNIDGAWWGNDTIWRTCLDLQRILHYGRLDRTLSNQKVRTVIHITDAIIAGDREGPLAPSPVVSGFLTGAANPAAAEWVHGRLMGFDPARIPITAHAFDTFPYPLTSFRPDDVRMLANGNAIQPDAIFPLDGRAFAPPKGWLGHCELAPESAHA